MNSSFARKSTLLYALGLLTLQTASAHDLMGIATEDSSLNVQQRIKIKQIFDYKRLLAEELKKNPSDGQPEAVVNTSLKWKRNKASVCFFSGNKEARDHVAKVAEQWIVGTSLKLDFGPSGNRTSCNSERPSDIRVSFNKKGYYSYIGTIAKLIDPANETLNLSGMDKSTFSESDDGIILHEFGHAIGFEHEHQSPRGGCGSEFNWDYIIRTYFEGNEEDARRNMEPLDANTTGLLTTSFDSKSNMLYSLNREAFINPDTAKCYISKPNNMLSAVDKAAAQTVYPLAPIAAPAAFSSVKEPGVSTPIQKSIKELQQLLPYD